jgi:hypothetical protein
VIWRRARGLGRRARRAQSLPALIAAVAILVTVLASARTVRQWRNEARATSTRIPLAVAAQWMRENLPRDATVGAWNAGMIGYLSERRVVNLDGLVNSWGFYLDGRHDLCRYWRGAGVTHLVDIFEIGREVDFINHYYAPGVDLSSCAGRLDRVWVGPPEGPTTKHAIAFRLR